MNILQTATPMEAAAKLVTVAENLSVDLDYSTESLGEIEHLMHTLKVIIGCYAGEVLTRNGNGTWTLDERKAWTVALNNHVVAYPIKCCYNFVTDDVTENVAPWVKRILAESEHKPSAGVIERLYGFLGPDISERRREEK